MNRAFCQTINDTANSENMWQRVIGKLINSKEFGRKPSWRNRSIIVEFAWRDWGKSSAGVPAEVRTEHFPNTSLRVLSTCSARRGHISAQLLMSDLRKRRWPLWSCYRRKGWLADRRVEETMCAHFANICCGSSWTWIKSSGLQQERTSDISVTYGHCVVFRPASKLHAGT